MLTGGTKILPSIIYIASVTLSVREVSRDSVQIVSATLIQFYVLAQLQDLITHSSYRYRNQPNNFCVLL